MAKVTFTIHKAGKHQRHSRRNQILDAAQRCFKRPCATSRRSSG